MISNFFILADDFCNIIFKEQKVSYLEMADILRRRSRIVYKWDNHEKIGTNNEERTKNLNILNYKIHSIEPFNYYPVISQNIEM